MAVEPCREHSLAGPRLALDEHGTFGTQRGACLPLDSADLVASAEERVELTEALFYAAMDRRVAGDAKGSDDVLRQVLSAGGLELMEFAIAREMLAGDKSRVPGPLPEVTLP